MDEIPRILIPLPTRSDLAYNRECWPQYADAVRFAGGTAVQAAPEMELEELLGLVEGCDGVLLPGSPADVSPERYGKEREMVCGLADEDREVCDYELLRHVFLSKKPLLGVCYGAQSLNVFCGGTLLQNLTCVPVNHAAGAGVGVAHSVMVELHSHLGSLLGPAEAEVGRVPINSSHHQAIGIPGAGLRVVARSAEDLVVEAVEAVDERHFIVGVQWHPERSTEISHLSRRIFGAFVGAAETWRAGRLVA